MTYETENPEYPEWLTRVKKQLSALTELMEGDFFAVGGRYGLEQFLDDPDSWETISPADKELLLLATGELLGVDLLNPSAEKAIRQYREEGVTGQPSEGGAKVSVYATSNPQLEIHILQYVNLTLGTRYDLVRAGYF